eukprot:932497-Alexandrium_andersonii.AAC.1
MSASLVGSEMCIRDRSTGVRRGCSCSDPRSQGGGHTPKLGFRCTAPVSYTHLTLPTICSV